MDPIHKFSLLVCPILLLACGDNLAGLEDSITPPDSGLPLADAAPVEELFDATPMLPDAGIPIVGLACTLEDVQPLLECVTENCLEALSDGTLPTCLAVNCGILFLTIPPECTQCILAGLSDPGSALDVCITGLDSGGPMF